jgi:hypothetical protein
MKRETYKGRKLQTTKGTEYGYSRAKINGVDLGRHMGSEDDALTMMHSYIDHADEVGIPSGRYNAEWYAPGTYELCEHDHPKEIGGECVHSYCMERRPAPVVEDPKKITENVEALPEDVTTPANICDPALTHYADGTRVLMTWAGGTKEGTAFGRYIGSAPYQFQAVRWDDESEDGVAPHVLSRVGVDDEPAAA